jgi:hypothetical protein
LENMRSNLLSNRPQFTHHRALGLGVFLRHFPLPVKTSPSLHQEGLALNPRSG